jgi:Ca2+-binding RTX toxin-like protein
LTTAQNTVGAGSDTLTSFENLTGSAFDDVLTGSTAANVLTGGNGNDVLNGGAGADTLIGGLGNDTYVVDNAGDVVTEAAGEGTDAVQSSIAYTLAANVENLTLTGTAAINGTGNAANNIITGNGAANVINGGAGADALTGGAGNDSFRFNFGEARGDVVTDFTGAGAAVGDRLDFYGYGTLATGATLQQVGATDFYKITPDAAHGGAAAAETIEIFNVFNLNTSIGTNDFILH